MAFINKFDFAERKEIIKRNIIRYNNFNKLPFIINKIFEVVLDCENGNLWGKALDSMVHVNELYAEKLKTLVRKTFIYHYSNYQQMNKYTI